MGASKSCCIGVEEDDKLLVTKLDLSHCGCIEVPNIVFNSERCIENLILSCNQITSLPPQLFHCQELKHLNLSDNYLESVPEAIGSLYNLVSLKLDKNNLCSLPESLKKCRKLKRLSLNNNNIKNLLSIITKVINLQEIYLNNCDIKYLTASIGRLSKLKIIEMRNNCLCSLPLSFARLQQLTRLDIGDNEFTEFPKCITNLTSLQELYMDNNYLEEIINLEDLKQLQHMDLSFNNIIKIHEGLGFCQQLNMLNLSHNFVETIPDTIEHAKQLQYFNLEANEINVLTNSIGKLSNVIDINISNNRINVIPTTIGSLRKLKYLNLSNNLIEELPIEIGSCTSISILNLSYNRLQTLPCEIGYLSGLVVLNLTGNLLTYLPVSINNLRQVKAIWLSSTQNVPLIPFVQETHGLTNITLPQVGETYTSDSLYGKNCTWQNIERKIRFAESEDASPGKLHRTPTPFPKELRAPYKKQHKQDNTSRSDADNYVNVVDGQVCAEDDDESQALVQATPIGEPYPTPPQGLTSVIREANIRKSNEGCREESETLIGRGDEEEEEFTDVGVNKEEKKKEETAGTDVKSVEDERRMMMERYEASLIDELKLERNSFKQKMDYYELNSVVVVDKDMVVSPDERYPVVDPQSVREMYHNDVVVTADNLQYNSGYSNRYAANLYQNTSEVKCPRERETNRQQQQQQQQRGVSYKPPPPQHMKIYETPPSSRPDSKQSMNSLTEEMRRRNISPPCYEIAKLYSTKAALFEQDRL